MSSARLAPVVASLALALVAACHPAPSARFAPAHTPDDVTASLLMRMNARQEAEVLAGITPALPPLVRRVWGVPTGEPWRLEVLMTPWRLTPEGRMDPWIDTTIAMPTARDRQRFAFRRAMEDSLTPPAPSRAWYVGTMRGVSVQQARTSGDSVIVQVDVSAGMRCSDGRNVMKAIAYDIALVRAPQGGLRLADRPPQWVAESGGTRDAGASCGPTPLVSARD